MSLLKRLQVSLLRILCGVPIVSLLVLGLLFAFFSMTWKGRCVGLSAVLFGGLLFASVGYWNRAWFTARRKQLFAVLIPAGLILVIVPAFLAPDGGSQESCARNCFLGGEGHFQRYSPWNIIPEVDQVAVGLRLVPLGDPYVDFNKARQMRELMLQAHQHMEASPEFARLGSVRGLTYRDLFRAGNGAGHYYVFLPETDSDAPIPCLVFLHGMGGNLKSYFWVMSQISTRMKCAVVAPTFGLGLWQKEESSEFIVDVTREAMETLPIDPKQIYLMGYSQGAVGVTRAAVREPGLYHGLIYLSPITEDDRFGAPEFESQKEDLRLLFLHGRNDSRIPCNFVEGTARTLRQTGYDVEIKIYDGEDHYLTLSQPEALLDELARFMVSSHHGPR